MADIELVIKIPEDEYKNILLTGKASFRAVNAIEAGTLLPKGHGRLIDADKAKETMMYEMCGTGYQGTAMGVLDSELYTPTIIEADGGDTETWNGYHGQVTAPKGTFKRIYADADGGDAE